MTKSVIGTTCAIAMLMAGTASAQYSTTPQTTQQKSTSSTSQAARNRTERITVNGCLIRGSEYAEVPHLTGYVLRDVRSVAAPNTSASLSSSTSTGATYGTETTGSATVSGSVSGQNAAGVEANKGNVGTNASIKGSEIDHTSIAENTEQKGSVSGSVGTTGSSTDNVGVTTPSTDAQGSTPGAGVEAQARSGAEPPTTPSASGAVSVSGATGTTGTTEVAAYSLEGVAKPTNYVGKRVEITGMVMNAPSTPRANANQMSRLRVTSVKVIPGSCSR